MKVSRKQCIHFSPLLAFPAIIADAMMSADAYIWLFKRQQEYEGEWQVCIVSTFYCHFAYTAGAGVVTSLLPPNFGKLFRRQQENEGTYDTMHCLCVCFASNIAYMAKAGH